jgi:hypothetical protein
MPDLADPVHFNQPCAPPVLAANRRLPASKLLLASHAWTLSLNANKSAASYSSVAVTTAKINVTTDLASPVSKKCWCRAAAVVPASHSCAVKCTPTRFKRSTILFAAIVFATFCVLVAVTNARSAVALPCATRTILKAFTFASSFATRNSTAVCTDVKHTVTRAAVSDVSKPFSTTLLVPAANQFSKHLWPVVLRHRSALALAPSLNLVVTKLFLTAVTTATVLLASR